VEEHFGSFLVARDGRGLLFGCIGLETYGKVGLLRSLAVESARRGEGVGNGLVEELFASARSRGIETLYLLTTTAERYFPRFGFEVIPRAEADVKLAASEELRGACPATAVLMRRRL
jgi:N-acetylglutamate synthase-like GNAT family acetyltransferase